MDRARAEEERKAAIGSVGETVERLRRGSGLTIEELGNASGLSVGLLSQIERGRGNPSLSTLLKISRGLGVPIGYFFTGMQPWGEVVHQGERKRLSLAQGGPIYQLLSPDMAREIEFLWIEYAPGVTTADAPFTHQGEECGLILGGRLIVHLPDKELSLGPGDSVYLNSTVPHWFENPGDEPTAMVWAIHPPSF